MITQTVGIAFGFMGFILGMLLIAWPAWLLLGVLFGVKLYFTRLNRRPVKFSVDDLLFKKLCCAACGQESALYHEIFAALAR